MQAHQQHSRNSIDCRIMERNIDAVKSEVMTLEKLKEDHIKYACIVLLKALLA